MYIIYNVRIYICIFYANKLQLTDFVEWRQETRTSLTDFLNLLLADCNNIYVHTLQARS